MQTATALDTREIEILRKLAEAAPKILEALTIKREPPATAEWKTQEEVMAELKCSKSWLIKNRNSEDFPYEFKKISVQVVRYRLKNGK